MLRDLLLMRKICILWRVYSVIEIFYYKGFNRLIKYLVDHQASCSLHVRELISGLRGVHHHSQMVTLLPNNAWFHHVLRADISYKHCIKL